jgi:hypothetical protein
MSPVIIEQNKMAAVEKSHLGQAPPSSSTFREEFPVEGGELEIRDGIPPEPRQHFQVRVIQLSADKDDIHKLRCLGCRQLEGSTI